MPAKQLSMLPEDEAKKPATRVMKIVASKTLATADAEKLKKVFTPAEIEEILAKRDSGKALNTVEHRAVSAEQRRLKKLVKEMEKGNKSRLILMPSLKGEKGFYKMYDFSALYYAYRLADRMGRKANIKHDSDRFSRMLHAVSLVNIDKFTKHKHFLSS